jgi:uncharacterized protein (DUF1330 family)
VISEVEILDESQGQHYRELAAAPIARHGGRYVVRGARPEVPEGDWSDEQRVVVVEFPTMAMLQTWYACADYAEALTLRQTALRRPLFVQGVEEAEASRRLVRGARSSPGPMHLQCKVRSCVDVAKHGEHAPVAGVGGR